ncbi:hypothetical protein TUN199_11474, partial [Pyrenophora tritici-repentis]
MTQDNILKSFQATGVWPMDADVILQRFNNRISEQDKDSKLRQHGDGDNWRELRKIFDAAVADKAKRKEYHGGAVFWSPRKLREARARDAVKQDGAEQQQLEKTQDREMKAAATLYKKQQAEAAKVARQHAAEEHCKAKKAHADELAAARALKKLQRDAATAQESHDTPTGRKRKASHKAVKLPAKRRRV